MAALRAALGDGRWHFQHGPMDLVIGASGRAAAVAAAHEAAWQRFAPLLDELVAELAQLREPVGEDCPLAGPVARRMWQACAPYRRPFITPMAAVAGAVAEAVIDCYAIDGVDRAWVNNGGDIALHLAEGHQLAVGLYADLARFDAGALRAGLVLDGRAVITSAMPVRGIATSGWRGRSFSLGIADSVTVFARTAAAADAAATVIANAVDVDDPRIERRPASSLKDDSDLGDLAVTVDVPPLGADVVRRALAIGRARAQALQDAGLILGCTLVCQRQFSATTPLGDSPSPLLAPLPASPSPSLNPTLGPSSVPSSSPAFPPPSPPSRASTTFPPPPLSPTSRSSPPPTLRPSSPVRPPRRSAIGAGVR